MAVWAASSVMPPVRVVPVMVQLTPLMLLVTLMVILVSVVLRVWGLLATPVVRALLVMLWRLVPLLVLWR